MSTSTATTGFPLIGLLTVIFVLAKIFGVVTWSWWWVFAPLWIDALLLLTIATFVVLVSALVAILIAIFG